MPLGSDCLVARLATANGVDPLSVALAASYMQRLRHRALARALPANGLTTMLAGDAYNMFLSRPGVFRAPQRGDPDRMHDQRGLLAAYLVCMHVAVKLVEKRPRKYHFNTLLHAMLHEKLSAQDLFDVEMWIMCALDWQLAPLCRQEPAKPVEPQERACRRRKRSRAAVDCPDGQKEKKKRALRRPRGSPTDVFAFDQLLLECDEEL